jgi:hypothetical protein
MNKFLALASTAAMIGATALTGAMPATAAPQMSKQQYVTNWCRSNPRDSSCNDFNHHNHSWSDSQYNNFYQSHRNQRGFSPLAAGIFGLAAGAIVGGAMNGGNHSSLNAQQRRCAAAYPGYNAATNMYVVRGHRQECRL